MPKHTFDDPVVRCSENCKHGTWIDHANATPAMLKPRPRPAVSYGTGKAYTTQSRGF